MDNLISNTQYGQFLDSQELTLSGYKQERQQYDELLRQQPQIWMFIPCKLVNGAWIVLEEALGADFLSNYDMDKFLEYEEAKDKVIFKDFKLHLHTPFGDLHQSIGYFDVLHPMWYSNKKRQWINAPGLITLENLVQYNLPLTKPISQIAQMFIKK